MELNNLTKKKCIKFNLNLVYYVLNAYNIIVIYSQKNYTNRLTYFDVHES